MKPLPRTLPLGQVCRLREPGPVVLLTVQHAGRANVMPMSWHTMMEFEPPLVGCVLSARHVTWDMLMATRECVIAVPTLRLHSKAKAADALTRSSRDEANSTRAPSSRLSRSSVRASQAASSLPARCSRKRCMRIGTSVST